MKLPPKPRAKQHTVKRCDGKTLRWRERWERPTCGECGARERRWEQVAYGPSDHMRLGLVYTHTDNRTYRDCPGCGERIPTIATVMAEVYDRSVSQAITEVSSPFFRAVKR